YAHTAAAAHGQRSARARLCRQAGERLSCAGIHESACARAGGSAGTGVRSADHRAALAQAARQAAQGEIAGGPAVTMNGWTTKPPQNTIRPGCSGVWGLPAESPMRLLSS